MAQQEMVFRKLRTGNIRLRCASSGVVAEFEQGAEGDLSGFCDECQRIAAEEHGVRDRAPRPYTATAERRAQPAAAPKPTTTKFPRPYSAALSKRLAAQPEGFAVAHKERRVKELAALRARRAENETRFLGEYTKRLAQRLREHAAGAR